MVLGVGAVHQFPGLKVGESDDVILRLLTANTDPLLAGMLGAAIMACVMASDSQILALCTMFSQDVFAHYGGGQKFGEAAGLIVEAATVRGLQHYGRLSASAESQIQFQARLKLASHNIVPAGKATFKPKPFGHPSEELFANLLDFYRLAWEYEPRSFPLQWDKEGNVTEAFTPDFYLPEYDLYVELTTMKVRPLAVMIPVLAITAVAEEVSLLPGNLVGKDGTVQRIWLVSATPASIRYCASQNLQEVSEHRISETTAVCLDELHRSRRLTSIHVTHNLNFAHRADRVIALERGQLVAASQLHASVAPGNPSNTNEGSHHV